MQVLKSYSMLRNICLNILLWQCVLLLRDLIEIFYLFVIWNVKAYIKLLPLESEHDTSFLQYSYYIYYLSAQKSNKLELWCFFLPSISSVIFGEDVAFGGVFRCTVGLRDKYGKLTNLLFWFVFFSKSLTLQRHIVPCLKLPQDGTRAPAKTYFPLPFF